MPFFRGVFWIACLVPFLSGCFTISPTTGALYEKLLRKRTMAVIQLENKTKFGERRLSDAASDILTTELLRSNNFTMVERERIDAVLKERELQSNPLADFMGLGKLLNCEYLIIGSISNYGERTVGSDLLIYQRKMQQVEVEIDLKIIRVTSGEIVYAAFGKGEASKESKSLLGLGESAGYDETLSGTALRSALSKTVQDIISYFETEL